jgi:hypothetical protein
MVVKACPKQPLCILYEQKLYMKGQILKAYSSICFRVALVLGYLDIS